MNFGEMKSFLKDTSLFDANRASGVSSPGVNGAQHANVPAHAKGKPGLAGLNQMPSAASIVERSQGNSLGFGILNKVLAGKLQSLNPQAPTPPPPEASENKSLFDFEEVAKNVLSFVDKALQKAKSNGADNDMLSGMLAKARQGVEDGFAQARDELDQMGQLNDDLALGIDKSYGAITEGLDKIEQNMFGAPGEVQGLSSAMVGAAYQASYSYERSSALSITTNDGDKVTINFAEAMAYQRSEAAAVYGAGDGEGNGAVGASYQMSESRFHGVGFSFSVEGDLDEDEKAAIADLVKNVGKLADEFFNGDLDKAFEQAMELGFDESELSGFALNMSRVETVSVAAAYQQVAQFDPEGNGRGPKGNNGQGNGQGQGVEGRQNLGQMIKPVANYLHDLLSFIEQAKEQLQEGSDLQSLVDQSVGRYLEFRGESDIPSALERFAEFNQRMLGSLEPQSPEDTATEQPAEQSAEQAE